MKQPPLRRRHAPLRRERAVHWATVWQVLAWLGSQTAALETALALLSQHDPADDLHRFVGAVAPRKYRSPQRRDILATGAVCCA